MFHPRVHDVSHEYPHDAFAATAREKFRWRGPNFQIPPAVSPQGVKWKSISPLNVHGTALVVVVALTIQYPPPKDPMHPKSFGRVWVALHNEKATTRP